jgi:hypothetical protein
VADAVEPAAGVVKRAADAVEPVTRAARPVTRAVAPIAGAVRPVVDAVQPVTRLAAPVLHVAEPVLELTDPLSTSLAPELGSLVRESLDSTASAPSRVDDSIVQPPAGRGEPPRTDTSSAFVELPAAPGTAPPLTSSPGAGVPDDAAGTKAAHGGRLSGLAPGAGPLAQLGPAPVPAAGTTTFAATPDAVADGDPGPAPGPAHGGGFATSGTASSGGSSSTTFFALLALFALAAPALSRFIRTVPDFLRPVPFISALERPG